ncbi:hypothetical protein HK101_000568 [Irineochytrium annulatum]|nr:hypothetical protein HK101_000568 [Irineochytrium annulatum]
MEARKRKELDEDPAEVGLPQEAIAGRRARPSASPSHKRAFIASSANPTPLKASNKSNPFLRVVSATWDDVADDVKSPPTPQAQPPASTGTTPSKATPTSLGSRAFGDAGRSSFGSGSGAFFAVPMAAASFEQIARANAGEKEKEKTEEKKEAAAVDEAANPMMMSARRGGFANLGRKPPLPVAAAAPATEMADDDDPMAISSVRPPDAVVNGGEVGVAASPRRNGVNAVGESPRRVAGGIRNAMSVNLSSRFAALGRKVAPPATVSTAVTPATVAPVEEGGEDPMMMSVVRPPEAAESPRSPATIKSPLTMNLSSRLAAAAPRSPVGTGRESNEKVENHEGGVEQVAGQASGVKRADTPAVALGVVGIDGSKDGKEGSEAKRVGEGAKEGATVWDTPNRFVVDTPSRAKFGGSFAGRAGDGVESSLGQNAIKRPLNFLRNAATFGSGAATSGSFAAARLTSASSFLNMLEKEEEEKKSKESGTTEKAFEKADVPPEKKPEPKAELTTGEEDETTIHQVRCKLYKMEDDKKWHERGVGNIKLNVNTKNDEARLLMRSDGVLRLILNVRIIPKMPCSQTQGRGVTFGGIEEADSTMRMFLAKVKDENAAENLLSHIKSYSEAKNKA